MTKHLDNSTLDTLAALRQAPSILKLKEEFRRAVENHGYDYFLCSAPPRVHEPGSDPILLDDWQREWRQRYAKRKYYLNDPILNELHRTAEPFTWSEAMARSPLSRPELLVMNEAADLGMSEGFVIPIYGVGGKVHAITMCGRAPRTDNRARAELHLFSIYAYARAKQLRQRHGTPSISLRRREQMALQWASAGKTDWEIGQILGISASAAHKHIENVKQRLGVGTRVQAIIEAIRQGHIHL